MKRRLLILVGLLMIFSVSISFGQDSLLLKQVNIHLQNIQIDKALDSLSFYTNSYFTYNSDLFDKDQKVTIEAQNKSLLHVLRQIIPDTTLNFQVIKKQIIISPKQEMIPDVSEPPVSLIREIKGIVTDHNNSEPLPYATVGVLGKYKGTITNLDGEFQLTLQPENFLDTLVISYVGYRNTQIPISEIKGSLFSVSLNEERVSLQEIFIRNTNPISLIKAAMNKVEQNYHSTPMNITAFYRESVLKSKKYMIYLESVLDIYKSSSRGSYKPDMAKVLKSRKIYDVNRLDTVSFRLQGGVNACLMLDIVKNVPDFLNSENFSLFHYHFADIRIFNNHPVYVIEFFPRPNLIDPNFRGTIYIDTQSLAIVQAKFGYPEDRVGELTESFITKRNNKTRVRTLKVEYIVSYRNINGKYYLDHTLGNLKFMVRNKRKLFAKAFESTFEMASTQWDTTNVGRIKYREALHPSTILSQEKFFYDPLFWNNQTFIQPEEDIQEALKRINKSMQHLAQEKGD